MCGRYGQRRREQRLEEYLRLTPTTSGDAIVRYNSHRALTRGSREPARAVELRDIPLGLVPFWSKDPKAGVRPINAKTETAHEKPMFRNLLHERRWLVPADCLYE